MSQFILANAAGEVEDVDVAVAEAQAVHDSTPKQLSSIAQAVCTDAVLHTLPILATASLQSCADTQTWHLWSILVQVVWPVPLSGARRAPTLRGSAWRLTFVGGLAHAGLLAASEIRSSELQETQQTATESCHLLRLWATRS